VTEQALPLLHPDVIAPAPTMTTVQPSMRLIQTPLFSSSLNAKKRFAHSAIDNGNPVHLEISSYG